MTKHERMSNGCKHIPCYDIRKIETLKKDKYQFCGAVQMYFEGVFQ